MAHNHPSGDTTPSTDDRRVTRRLARACDTVGIPLLDHIITGHAGTWISLTRLGVIQASLPHDLLV